MHRPARFVLLLLTAALAITWSGQFAFTRPVEAAAVATVSGPRQPVLVELFTSEGCSSCPPADALLAQLDATQFVPGAQSIVLSEHVTYWNQEGWRDPFSSDAMTDRQKQYVEHFGLESPYTPEVVVDGSAQLVGNDSNALSSAIAHAALTPKTSLSIESVQWTGDTVSFAVHADASPHAMLMVALAEDATHSIVSSGENAGRTLHHVAVVRTLEEKKLAFTDGRPLTLKVPGRGKTSGQSSGLRLVVFLADRGSGRILAVAEKAISQSSAPANGQQTQGLAAAATPPAR
jgi:hypothetical protein